MWQEKCSNVHGDGSVQRARDYGIGLMSPCWLISGTGERTSVGAPLQTEMPTGHHQSPGMVLQCRLLAHDLGRSTVEVHCRTFYNR